jgi:hypothetical protein
MSRLVRGGAVATLVLLTAACGHESSPSAARPGSGVAGTSGSGAGQGGSSGAIGEPATSGGSATASGGTNPSAAGAPSDQGGAQISEAAAGEGGAAGAAGAASDIDMILETYRSFSPQTPQPVNVSGYLFGLCRMPTLPETEFLASIHGDGRYLQEWANSGAEAGIASRGSPAFAPGSVIVKEKYAGPQASEATLVALGIMIKREPGFDADSGDWDYAYYEPALGVVRSAEQTSYCAGCHARAEATDYVFVDGLVP